MFDVDPKWAELVKERGNLPHDLQKRLSGNDRSYVNKGKSPGRPPMMPSPTSQQSANQANLAATSMASGLNFPSLGNLNNSLLSGLSLGNFDPKNNPLLMPFGGLPNLGALSGLGNLSNLSNMSLTNSLFANLAGLGLPSLAGMEAALGATATSTTAETNPVVSSVSSKNTGSTNITSASKSSRSKLDPPTSKSSVPSTSSASSTISTTTPFPFFFPNPSLLYTPLGLGGLNPFSMQPGGVSSAYESLAQCGLLNPSTSSASTIRKSASSTNNSRQRDTITESTTKRKDTEKKSRYTIDPTITLQQYTDMTLHNEERRRLEPEKRETVEQNDVADLSERRTERKNKEQEMKEALEHLSRTSAELLTRNLEDQRLNDKRSRNDHNQSSEQQTSNMLEVTLEPVNKKPRIEIEVNTRPVTTAVTTTVTSDITTIEEQGMRSSNTTIKQSSLEEINAYNETSLNTNKKEIDEITAAITSISTTVTIAVAPTATPTSTSTPTRTPTPVCTPTSTPTSTPISTPTPLSITTPTSTTSMTTVLEDAIASQQSTTNIKSDSSKLSSEMEEDNKGTKGKKARSGKRLSVEPPPERKNLRSSAGRQARAAAERQARMEGELQSDQQETHTNE